MPDTNKCAHPACNCRVGDDKKYCSHYCHDAGSEEEEIACDCGHPGCDLSESV